MAKRGRAGAALAVAAVGSFIAGTFGIVLIMFFAPALASLALKFGAPEFFALAMLGLFALSRISGGSFWYSLIVLALGLVICTVGIDPISFTNRYTMGIVNLTRGIELVPVVMGLFGVAEVLSVAEKAGGLPQIIKVKFKELFPTLEEWKRALPAMLRGSATGFVWGLIPGPSPIISTFASYRLEQQLSKNKAEFGHGAIEGVAGPEAANNGASSTAMVPILSLGIPFTPASALLLACLLIQGVQVGPLLMQNHPEVFWGVIASMYIGNVALLVLNLPLVGLWVSLLRIPQSILLALILLLTLVGTYALNNSFFDLIVLVISGILGYILKKIKVDVSPLVVALVLGRMMEEQFRSSLAISYGSPFIFFTRPISGTLLSILFLILIGPWIWKRIRKRRSAPGTA
jgi:putative tricarboxylic transport membrane protein